MTKVSGGLDKTISVIKKIAHSFDRVLKCRPTRIKRVTTFVQTGVRTNEKDISTSNKIFFVEADKPWVKSPEYASLHMLFVRLGLLPELKVLLNNVPLDKVPNKIEKVYKDYSGDNEDKLRARLHALLWVKLLKDYEKTFKKKKFTNTFELQKDGASYGGCYLNGIDSLCENNGGTSIDEVIEYEDDDYYEEDYYD